MVFHILYILLNNWILSDLKLLVKINQWGVGAICAISLRLFRIVFLLVLAGSLHNNYIV